MESTSAQLKCGACGVFVFGMMDLLRHKKECEDRICVICMDRHASSFLEPCCHNKFCSECIQEWMSTTSRCPYCRATVQHVYGILTLTPDDQLRRAARYAINNNAVVGQPEALATLEWDRFLATVRGDVLQLSILDRLQQMILNSWPQVVARASQTLHENQMEVELVVDAMEGIIIGGEGDNNL